MKYDYLKLRFSSRFRILYILKHEFVYLTAQKIPKINLDIYRLHKMYNFLKKGLLFDFSYNAR